MTLLTPDIRAYLESCDGAMLHVDVILSLRDQFHLTPDLCGQAIAAYALERAGQCRRGLEPAARGERGQ